MRPRITILAIIVTFMVGAQALADSKEKEARLHFQQGVELYQADDYEGASIEFRRAYEQNPSYRILYNIGQAENELRHYAAALVAYKQYLAEGGNEIDKGRRKEVVKELERLATLVGTIEVACLTPDALVIVDSEEKGHTPWPALSSSTSGVTWSR